MDKKLAANAAANYAAFLVYHRTGNFNCPKCKGRKVTVAEESASTVYRCSKCGLEFHRKTRVVR